LLIQILKKTPKESVLVFTRTKHSAKKVALKLENAGFTATSLQGNLSQNKRQSAMQGFRDGTLQILVATDIASRGIDVASISHVINYDIPSTVETYIHRIGRTGRAAKEGEAFTLITREDESQVKAIERVLGRKVEQRKFDDFDYNAAAPARTLQNVATRRPQQRRRSDNKH
jgi:superfamily II DNA/RNA helicase